MGRPRATHCKGCGRHIDDVGPLSRNRKLCEQCGLERQTAAIVSISHQQGPTYDRYLAGLNAWTNQLNQTAGQASTNAAPAPSGKPPAGG